MARREAAPCLLMSSEVVMSSFKNRIRSAFTPAASGGSVAAAPPLPLGEVFRRFWPFAKPYRRWIALSVVFVAILPAIEAAEIWLFQHVVDDVLVPRDLSNLA